MTKQVVFIADIVQSKKIQKRHETQKRLLDIMDVLNNSFANDITRKVVVSSGDSFQGLFKNSSSAFLYIRAMQMFMYPIKIRASIGMGKLDYLEEKMNSNELDGEAYHNAKKGLDAITKNKSEEIVYVSDELSDSNVNIQMKMYIKLRHIEGTQSHKYWLINELMNPMSLNGEISYAEDFDIILRWNFDETNNLTANDKQIREIKRFSLKSLLSVEGKIVCKNSDYVLRGIQGDLAEIMGTSRQNVNKFFRKFIMDERMYSGEIARLLAKKDGGG